MFEADWPKALDARSVAPGSMMSALSAGNSGVTCVDQIELLRDPREIGDADFFRSERHLGLRGDLVIDLLHVLVHGAHGLFLAQIGLDLRGHLGQRLELGRLIRLGLCAGARIRYWSLCAS